MGITYKKFVERGAITLERKKKSIKNCNYFSVHYNNFNLGGGSCCMSGPH